MEGRRKGQAEVEGWDKKEKISVSYGGKEVRENKTSKKRSAGKKQPRPF